MTFEENLRARIKDAPHNSAERNLLKVVLGEVQQKAAVGKFTDEQGHTIVRKMIKGNEETLGHLPGDDPRRGQLTQENTILATLLPQYWPAARIRRQLEEDGVDVRAAKNDGQATGMAMGHLKKLGAPVEGDTVKAVVAEMRQA